MTLIKIYLLIQLFISMSLSYMAYKNEFIEMSILFTVVSLLNLLALAAVNVEQ